MSESPGIFLPYQEAWINDENPLKLSEKSRRIGISWAEAYNSVLKSAASREAGGMNTYYLSYNKSMTRQFVQDCTFFARILNIAASAMQEVVIQNEKQDITMYRITFDSGYEIAGMPSDAYNLRSKQGRVVFDEAAFCGDMDGVLKAAKALLIWGGQLSVISTHNGDDNPFNLLIKDARAGREKGWSIHRTTFDEAVEAGLYKKICERNGEKWTKKKEGAFVKKIREIYANNIDEELNVIPRPSAGRYFGRGLLDLCTGRNIVIRRLSCKNDFLHKSENVKENVIVSFFNTEIAPILSALKHLVFFGNDFGRSGDLTTYWLNCDTGAALETKLIIELQNVPFEQQELFSDMLTDLLDKRKIFGGGALDSRGNGQQLAEHAMLRHPGAIICVMENAAWYGKYGADLHALMESKDFTVPDDDVIKGDFAIVTLKNGIPYIPPIRTGDRDGKGTRHGDAASAALLSVCAWRECAADPEPVFAVTNRKDPWKQRI